MPYLDDEDLKLRAEQRKKLPIRLERLQIFSIVLAILLSFFFFAVHAESPRDNRVARWFPSTWVCGKCGYSNYDGICSCAVCGTSR